MPYLPILQEGRQSRKMTDTFRGYVHKLKIGDGQFYDTKNLSSSYYPVLATREPREEVDSFSEFQGMCSIGGKLAWVDSGTLYYDGCATGITGLTEGKKQLVITGAYICVFPDGMYYNSVEPSDSGSMNTSLVIENADLEILMCNMDGVEYEDAEEGSSAPNTTTDGMLWIDTKYRKLKQYSMSTMTWTEIQQVYTKIIFPAQPEGNRPSDKFKVNDGVSMSGFDEPGLNGSKILYGVGENYVVVSGILKNESTQSGATIEIKQEVPEMDFVIECQNRLWGCFYGRKNGRMINEIYCCALGDFKNWSRYLGIASDSYRASVGTEGPWTGAVNYLGYPTFFKEKFIQRVTVSATGAHQIMDTPARGVQQGSEGSLVLVNEALYYKSASDVCVYTGGFPASISDALGDVKYHQATAGAINGKYYISMLDQEDAPHLFVYDMDRKMWIREDNTQVRAFAAANNELYAAAGSLLYALSNSSETAAEDFDWYAESGMLYYEYPNKKYISRLNLRLKMEKSTRLKIFIEYDSDGIWRPSGEVFYEGTGTITVPVKPRRCDHLRYRLEGRGFLRLFSIAKIFEEGSDY